ncbi:FkbM family methyltransferase [Nanoarchaeota archaeon]
MKVIKNGYEFTVQPERFFETLKRSGNVFHSSYYALFWRMVNHNFWEPTTYKIFDRFLDSKHSYVELAAWIGPTLLYGCQIAKHCYAIEPDLIALKSLKKNISLNKKLKRKISLYEGAIWNKTGTLSIKSTCEIGASSPMKIESSKTNDVDCLTFQEFVKQYGVRACNFIKIDIEGSEAIVLPTMKSWLKANKPTLHLSLHPGLFPDKKNSEIIDVLKIYKNIYNRKGKLLSMDKLERMLSRRRFFDIVATDLEWLD